MSSDIPAISLVIPAFNEAALLPRLLDSVEAARRRYSRGADAVEVIVADNGSTDATAAIAHARGCVVAPVGKRAIAASRNGGAAVARGAIVCFIDADSIVHADTFDVIEARLDPRVIGGATGVTLERWSPGIALTFAAIAPLAVLMNIDTGVVFCRRADFERIGGYDESMLFAEDVDFLWRLRRLGRADGRRLRRATRAKAIASTRKFDKYGDWHYLTRMPGVVVAWMRGRGARNDFVRRYWYEDR